MINELKIRHTNLIKTGSLSIIIPKQFAQDIGIYAHKLNVIIEKHGKSVVIRKLGV
ncbi:MAG: hypothetical protein HY223_05165 [Thaumarchaeota archaeon]|nr:hypothetical protein [Nitrososphaerota archaeon]MBI3639688.1 hypothetical protein [Nitrososphaerota archaeon]